MIQTGHCPITNTRGKKVDSATVKSLLVISLEYVRDTQYYFCAEKDCDIVYFTDDDDHHFSIDDIREDVYQKDPHNSDTMICYCFRHTIGDIREKFEDGDDTSIIDSIHRGIKAGQCACDWRNPQGDCCLGNVRLVIKSLKNTEQID